MRPTRQILRLRDEGASIREIGCRMAVARSTVQEMLKRAAQAGLGWPLPEAMNDTVLEQRLFAGAATQLGARRRPEPDWARPVPELKPPGVTLTVLWDECRAVHPDGYAHSRFCDLFRAFEKRLSPVMRQHHRPGDKVFVDFSGKTLPIVDPVMGEIRVPRLMEKASAAFLIAVKRRMRAVQRASGQELVAPATLTAAERIQYDGWKRRAAEEETIRALHAEGVGIKEIVGRTGRSRKLVREVLRGGRTEPFRPRAHSLEAWLDRLNTEWSGDCHSGAELWRRLRAAGFAGSQRVSTRGSRPHSRRRSIASPRASLRTAPLSPPRSRRLGRTDRPRA